MQFTFASLWELLGGLGLFLFGMFQMEEALKYLAGRSFKLFLKKHTEKKFEAILSGTVITAILQSSSLVMLMVLAFVGAGVMNFRNALSVSIGSNLGTTLDNWLVAYVGFKFNIEIIALPFIVIGVVIYMLVEHHKKWQNASKLIIGFGLLFFGLSLMKNSATGLFQNFSFENYKHLPSLFFVFLGFCITAIIQSSSATMAILMSALYAGVIPFATAAYFVIGSELGGSIKIIIGSMNGIAEKKRMALGNFIFNIVITLLAFVFIDPLLYFITDIVELQNEQSSLVLLQSMMNLAGILLFYPFMEKFCLFLEGRFKDSILFSTFYIKKNNLAHSGAGMEIMEREAEAFVFRSILLNVEAFHLERTTIPHSKIIDEIHFKNDQFNSYAERYQDVKKAEGEIVSFYYRINEAEPDRTDVIRLERLMSCVRNAMYASKCIKDVYEDRMELRNTADEEKYNQYKIFQDNLNGFYSDILHFLTEKKHNEQFGELVKIIEKVHKEYDLRVSHIYTEAVKTGMHELDISTLLNVNRELFSSCKAIVFAVKDLIMDEESAANFDNIPLSVLK